MKLATFAVISCALVALATSTSHAQENWLNDVLRYTQETNQWLEQQQREMARQQQAQQQQAQPGGCSNVAECVQMGIKNNERDAKLCYEQNNNAACRRLSMAERGMSAMTRSMEMNQKSMDAHRRLEQSRDNYYTNRQADSAINSGDSALRGR